eukprot:4706278-Amphidinium_carterae.2
MLRDPEQQLASMIRYFPNINNAMKDHGPQGAVSRGGYCTLAMIAGSGCFVKRYEPTPSRHLNQPLSSHPNSSHKNHAQLHPLTKFIFGCSVPQTCSPSQSRWMNF